MNAAMGVFGGRLKREREMRGVTLDEIAESTKISRRHLQSLEDESFNRLPGGIFNKGFVRAYARYLGIDEDQAVADYVAASNEQAPPEDKFPLEIIEDKKKDPRLNPKKSHLPLLLALFALVAVVAVWTYWNQHKAASENAGSHSLPLAADSVTNTVEAAGRESAQPAAPAVQSSAPSSTRSPAPSRTAPEGKSSVDRVTIPRPRTMATAWQQPVSGSQVTVTVRALEDAWVSVSADGKTMMEQTLPAGSQKSFHAGEQIILKTGNAAGLEVSYNGKPLADLDREKKVQTLVFSPTGFER